jgi:hypothetical protein
MVFILLILSRVPTFGGGAVFSWGALGGLGTGATGGCGGAAGGWGAFAFASPAAGSRARTVVWLRKRCSFGRHDNLMKTMKR